MLELDLDSPCLRLMQVISVLVVLCEVDVQLLSLLLHVDFALQEASIWVPAAYPCLLRSTRTFHLGPFYLSCTFQLVHTLV